MKNFVKTKILLGIALLLICAVPGTALAGIANGGFESGLDDWTVTGDAAAANVAWLDGIRFDPVSGILMASLAYNKRSDYVWENTISQEIDLTQDDNYFGFYYNFWTYDEAPFDDPGFIVAINGKTILSKSAGDIGDGTLGTLDYTGWKFFSIDISEYYSPTRPASIMVSFAAGNAGDTNPDYASGVFIDGMEITPDPPAVPVPTSLLLMVSGLLGFVGLRRRKTA